MMQEGLSPASAAVLAHLDAIAPDWTVTGPIEFRAWSDAVMQPPDLADRVVSVDAAAGEIPVRIYRREEADGVEPVLLFYHGGGFISGSIASHDRLCHRLARLAGCAIVSVDYRLAPEHVFPAAVEDAFEALRWVAEHGEAYKLDTSRIAVGGDSAGGTLAAVVSMRARSEGGPAVRHQLLIYPGTDLLAETQSRLLFETGFFLEKPLVDLCIAAYVPSAADRALPWASPLRAEDFAGLPSATIITAGCDPLRDEGEAFAARLGAAGVTVDLERYSGVFHGFVSMFGLIPEADAALAYAAANLRRAMA